MNLRLLYVQKVVFRNKIGENKFFEKKVSLNQEVRKNKFATQGRFNKMKTKRHKKVTPYPFEMLKLLKLTTPRQNF